MENMQDTKNIDPEVASTEKPLKKAGNLFNKWGALAVLFLALMVIFIVLIVVAFRSRTNKTVNTDLTIDPEIVRNAFRADIENPILPSNSNNASSTNSVVVFTSPRGGSLNSTSTATTTSGTGQDVVPTVYTNSSLGFSMSITNLWQATEANDGHTIIFTNAKGENISVQVYSSPDGGLAVVESQLSGSDSVRNLTKSTFQGEPALEFLTTTGLQAVAVIHGNKLYYIMGSVISAEPISSFKFQ